jgi:hypothetical protein
LRPKKFQGSGIRRAMISWALVLALLTQLIAEGAGALPLCGSNADTYGRWVDVDLYHNTSEIQAEATNKFALGGPGEALNFSRIWIPDDCSIHRFTNHSIHRLVTYMMERNRTTTPFRTIFMGDSATRGLICGWTRIMSGSELYGPCENEICGRESHLAITHKDTHKLYNVYFGENIEVTFMYIKSFTDKYSNWMVEGNINKKPYAVIVNTGAWDFDRIARQHMGEVAAEECNTDEMERASLLRTQPSIQNYFLTAGDLAKQLGVRTIYRTNHYNNRFGVHCADDRFISMLNGSNWEIWDNTRITKDVWRQFTRDGFHFDRHRTHTVRHHQLIVASAKEEGFMVPGMLEMQMTQSMLHALFHDALRAFIAEGLTL